MRNAIRYYYDIDINEIYRYENGYVFDKYVLKQLKKSFDYSLYDYLVKNNIYFYKVIKNKNNEIVTLIDRNYYILLNRDREFELNLDLIINCIYILNVNKKINWDVLWEKKIDYYEKYNSNRFIIDDQAAFHYYIGLSENAIKYFRDNSEECTVGIVHDRIDSVYDFFSPDNTIIDSVSRDIAEYIKLSFFKEKINLNEIKNIIDKNILRKSDCILLFSRLMFPTYYYDCIEKEEDISKYSSKIIQYEQLLNNIYIILNTKYSIPKVDWIIKNM